MLNAFFALLLATSPAPAKTTTPPAPATGIIRSRRTLEHYLHDVDLDASPLGALSPGTRKHFLAGLAFGPEGPGGFPPGDLDHELIHPRIVRLLSLFGAQAFAEGLRRDGIL